MLIAGTLAALLLVPFAFLLGAIGKAEPAVWQHVKETVLGNYLLNTLLLILATGVATCFLGTTMAVLVSLFSFPGKRFFSVALLLPLALPTYIAGYAFSGLTSYTGPIHLIGRAFGYDGLHADIMNAAGLIFVLSVALYPYVFATVRVALQSRYNSYLESGQSLGMSFKARFFRVLLPLMGPAIAGGVFLVMMEVLNDYGAMKYFGIPTFTMGIFNTWFGMGDLGSAVRLALMLFALVGVLSALERWYTRRFRVVESTRSRKTQTIQLRGVRATIATLSASLIFIIGFVAPCSYLVWLLVDAPFTQVLKEWPNLAKNSFLSALAGAVLILAVVLITQFVRLLLRSKIGFAIGKSISIGYSIPGAIIAVGVLLFSSFIDTRLTPSLALTGSMIMLVFAYTIRFSGVAYQPLHAESEKRSARLFEAAQSLQISTQRIFRQIYLPISSPGIRLAAILVIIDVLKELPLTLILRPFNFSTLATKAFEYADDEMLARAALPALSVIAVGLIPVLLLHRLLRN